MGKPIRALIVEDSTTDAELLLSALQQGGYEPAYVRVDTAEGMSQALNEQAWDIVIADYVMPHFSGLAALELLKASGIDLPFVIVSGRIGEDIAVEAMKAGAHDYLLKGHLARLVPAIDRELNEVVVRRERRRAEEERDRLMRRLQEVNEQLILTSLRAQDQADQSQRLAAELKAILAAIAEAVIVYGPEGEIIRMNLVAAQLLGYKVGESGEPVGEHGSRPSLETMDGKTLPRAETPVAHALCGETVRGVVIGIRRPKSKVVWATVSAAPIRTSDDKLFGVVATFADITTLRRLQPAYSNLR